MKCVRQARQRVSAVVRVASDFHWLLFQTITSASEQVIGFDSKPFSAVARSRSMDAYMDLSRTFGLQSMSQRINDRGAQCAAVEYLLSNIIRKYELPDKNNAMLRRANALANVIAGEAACSRFNTKGRKVVGVSDIIRDARIFTARILGDVLPDWEVLCGNARHGPGTGLRNGFLVCSSYDKYANFPYPVTSACREYAVKLIESDERWLGALEDAYRRKYAIDPWCILDRVTFWEHVLMVVPGNRITTVPKDVCKDRPIAIEPEINMMLQLSVDRYIRRRLRRFHIDLDSQAVINRLLAREGSTRTDYYSPATIDLSNASDTVSLGIAKLLLPEPWYRYLCRIRSPKGELPDGKFIRYSKLSSMGNGFTFAIESLIFFALASAVSKEATGSLYHREMSIFGDDIIVPEGFAPRLIQVLTACGFSLNLDKTFVSGCVKESCGTDWCRGFNYRAVYARRKPELVLELYSLRNRLLHFAGRHCLPEAFIATVDSFFLRYMQPNQLVYGPFDGASNDGWWQCPRQNGYDTLIDSVAYHGCWSVTTDDRRIDREGFLFYKLMNDLQSSQAFGPKTRLDQLEYLDSSRFSVPEKSKLKARITRRVCSSQWSSADSIYDYCLTAAL